ncbi:MAG: hypothetical protein M3Z22_06295, partial [Verrucomicrobiota bacterium]|nr:hypothetical protein [Verrucomicrobiota bacterium]
MNRADYLALALGGLLLCVLVAIFASVWLRRRHHTILENSRSPCDEILLRIEALVAAQERQERGFREELGRSREETAAHAKTQRDELSGSLRNLGDSTVKSIAEIGAILKSP